VQLRPGTDCYLLLGMLAVIVAGELVDTRACRDRAVGFDELRAVIGDVDVVDMARRCGIEPEQLIDVATRFARASSASILMDLGAEQTRFSTLNAYLVRVLLAVTGNLGSKGGNVYVQSFNPPGAGKTRGTPERALVSGIAAIRALGNYAMFSPSLVPEEVMADHPHRLRAVIVEGSNPLLSFADTPRWRAAIAYLDLLVVIDPAMTETAREADYVLPTPVGYEKWEVCGFPSGYPEIHIQVRPPVVPPPPDALPEPEIYARLAEAMNLFGPPPKVMKWLGAKVARSAHAGGAFLVAAMAAARRSRRGGPGVHNRILFWSYRSLGAHLRDPALAAIWLICQMNALGRREAVLRTLGPAWRRRLPHEIGAELFERVMAHPEGVELAKLSTRDNLGDTIEFEDGKVRLLPEQICPEIRRAIAAPEPLPMDYPLVLAAGVRTRWTANTIQRDPAWRKGKGPHCELAVSVADAQRLGIDSGAVVRVETRRGAVQLPARIDDRLREGLVTIPNGFGMVWGDDVVGVNANELTAAEDRDPFTGCPYHKYVPCRVSVVD
jgi:anaerobic selenocysteine-containing dehydrogenase